VLVAIHAGLRTDRNAPGSLWIPETYSAYYPGKRLGGIIGVVRFVERIGLDYMTWKRRQNEHLQPLECYRPDRKGLVFADAVRLPDIIPCRGRLGLWTLPEETDRVVRAVASEMMTNITPGDTDALRTPELRPSARE